MGTSLLVINSNISPKVHTTIQKFRVSSSSIFKYYHNLK